MKIILVVEDEGAIAQVVRAILEEEGYQVVVATNGRDGWVQLTTRHPDLVLCDLMLPGLSGGELFRRMQADAHLAAVPVVLMSAAAEPELRNAANYAGFLRKPFELGTLLGLVEQALGAGANPERRPPTD